VNADETVPRFLELFHEVFLRFHRRVPVAEPRLTPESLAVLRHLRASGPMTVAESMRHFARSQAAMSAIFERLERRGLVRRIEDERDRRRRLVWLTDLGRRTVESESTALSPRLLQHAVEQLRPDERAVLVASFERLLATDKAPSAIDGASPHPDPSTKQ
jgi:DNA-binding MarR family transcriptional regulator